MRRIEILDDLHLRFPERNSEFDLGVEVGAIAVLMAMEEPLIQRTLSAACVEQLRPLAERFRYALIATSVPGGMETSLVHFSGRPQLRLVQ